MKKAIIYIIIILVLAAVIYGVNFIYTNTSFFSGDVPAEELQENNFNEHLTNQDVNENLDLITLSAQELSVPESYKFGAFSQARQLNLPAGFSISVYAAGMVAPRFFTFNEENSMIVADKDLGEIVLLPDNDKDGVADEKIIIDTGLTVPHSVLWYEGDLFSAEEDRVVVYRDFQNDGTYSAKDVIIDDLPTGWADGTAAGHQTRTLAIGPDEKLYVSVGSSCNLCEEVNPKRAAIVRYDLDGSNEEIYAEGLRNSVGIAFKGDELWAVNNGRDRIGDDIPPEEVNVITESGQHYGWPYCYGDGVVSPEYEGERENFCANETVFPEYNMQAHSAPLGMSFVPGNAQIPAQLAEDMFIAFHGSWNRTVPTGYKVVRLDITDESAQTINFITGWLEEDGDAWGRPVGVGFDNDGIMYISDDKAGAIYQVTYEK